MYNLFGDNMSDFSISITKPGTKEYPLHQHPDWEVMYYLSGNGHLATENEEIPFEPGSIIIVPPRAVHGSVSQNGFVNISIGGNFNHLFRFGGITVQKDHAAGNGERLAKLIYENRYADPEYLSALCNAYAHFLLKNAEYEKPINRAINKIIDEATGNFFDPAFEMKAALHKSGYTEDYIRAEFKKATAMSPIDFLTKVRIEHAIKLIEIYGQSISVSELTEACGFDDPIYFSRRFKQFAGCSPSQYKKRLTAKAE